MAEILQSGLPFDVSGAAKLPGIKPMEEQDWIRIDEVYAEQMAHRAKLLSTRRANVLAVTEGAEEALSELLDKVSDELATRPGFSKISGRIVCPDGRQVIVDHADPLGTIGQLVQEDMCILQKSGDEHVLTAAVLCFPASWRLSEKIGRPLIDIHAPVQEYTANIATRVQRLFDGIQVGKPLGRFNMLWYDEPELHQPRSIKDPRRVGAGYTTGRFFRSEHQCLTRLPSSGAVVFSIHTYVLQADVALRLLKPV